MLIHRTGQKSEENASWQKHAAYLYGGIVRSSDHNLFKCSTYSIYVGYKNEHVILSYHPIKYSNK